MARLQGVGESFVGRFWGDLKTRWGRCELARGREVSRPLFLLPL